MLKFTWGKFSVASRYMSAVP